MKIATVINAYGKKNIGDLAILNVAIDIIKEALGKDYKINILREDMDINKQLIKPRKVSAYLLPYGYAIKSRKKKASYHTKLFRFIKLYIFSYSLVILDKYSIVSLPNKGLYSYISAIKIADLVIGMGGGYFVSRHPIKDYFGLGLSLLTIYIAKIYGKKIIFLPMSVGPFASSHHEKLITDALKGTTIIARDKITLRKLKLLDPNGEINSFFAPDLAILFNNHSYNLSVKKKSNYIVLTALDWLHGEKQNQYEESLSKLVDYIWDKYGLKTKFIPMAFNKTEDDDTQIAKKIKHRLKEKQIFNIVKPHSLKQIQKIIGLSRIGIYTRMHSAVLSTTVRTPFIVIGYGHKTRGFIDRLKLNDWFIDINEVNFTKLKNKLEMLMQEENYTETIRRIKISHKRESQYKDKILNSIQQI